MRLTLVNNESGQTAFTMYPEDKYSILESMDWCQIPYGSGEYRHLAVNPYGTFNDDLLEELAGVIENEAHPPSIQELNHLGGQLQRMTEVQRTEFGRQISGAPEATIIDAINTAHRLLSEEIVYDGRSMAERSVLLGEDEPYIRVEVYPADGEPPEEWEQGVWLDCPASEGELAALADTLGVDTPSDLAVCSWDGLLAVSMVYLNENDSPFVTLRDINKLARTMKEKEIVQSLGKFKALLQMESCMDFDVAADLAGKLDHYEYYRQSEFDRLYQSAGLELDWDEANQELEFEETDYGLIRPAGEQNLDQQFIALKWDEWAESPNPLLNLTGHLYQQTDGLCKAGAGPDGIGLSTVGDSKIHLRLSFDPPPVLNNMIFPDEIEQYAVQMAGYWAESGEPVRREELMALLDNADPATQNVALALWALAQETLTVSTEECNEAFNALADLQMREAYGTPDGAPLTREVTVEEPESGPTLGQQMS